jgi:hypothetical protein
LWLELECGRNGGLKRELAAECASQFVSRLGNRALAKRRKYALAVAFEKKTKKEQNRHVFSLVMII